MSAFLWFYAGGALSVFGVAIEVREAFDLAWWELPLAGLCWPVRLWHAASSVIDARLYRARSPKEPT